MRLALRQIRGLGTTYRHAAFAASSVRTISCSHFHATSRSSITPPQQRQYPASAARLKEADHDHIFVSDFPQVEVASKSYDETILDVIRTHSLNLPHQKALVSAENPDDFVTFTQLYDYSHCVAGYLYSIGFGYRDIACAVLPNCLEYVPIFLGCSMQGGALSGASNQLTEYELRQRFLDCKPKVVFCDSQALPNVSHAANNCPNVPKIVVVGSNGDNGRKISLGNVTQFSDVLQRYGGTHSHSSVKIDAERDLLMLPYSSGTSGPPKGVMLSHKNFGTMMNVVHSHFEVQFSRMNPNWDATKESICLLLPFYHIFGIGVLMNTIRTGSCGVVMRQFSPEVFCQTLQNYRMSHVYLVPPLLLFLAKSPIVENYDFSHLQLILTGAAQVGKEVADEVKRRIPTVGQVAQGYGMTEVSMASHFPVFDEPNHASVGKLMPNFEMQITDVETGRSLPVKEVGEVRVRGPTVMMGYYNRPEATDQTIDEKGWLRTGDIGYTDEDGHLYIVDRMKELIKVKGLQVSPCELEDLLLSHPGIRDCAVIGLPDERSGEVPKAFIVRSDEGLAELQVIHFVKERVSPHKQLAGGVEFVNEIPKSAAGKILRRVLRDKANQS